MVGIRTLGVATAGDGGVVGSGEGALTVTATVGWTAAGWVEVGVTRGVLQAARRQSALKNTIQVGFIIAPPSVAGGTPIAP